MSEQHVVEAILGLVALVTTGVVFAALCIYFPQGARKEDRPNPPSDSSHVAMGAMWHEGVEANVEVLALFYSHWLHGGMLEGSPLIPVRHKGQTYLSPAKYLSEERT